MLVPLLLPDVLNAPSSQLLSFALDAAVMRRLCNGLLAPDAEDLLDDAIMRGGLEYFLGAEG